ncbi:MAG: PIN domain-containing protein [Bacteroidetes bacterium]|nr:PIN domain-containing protein [Bacteroidota bacterium]
MKDRAFFDTNILVYLYSDDEPVKRKIASELLTKGESIITIQVLKEFTNTLRKKYSVEWQKISAAIDEILLFFILYPTEISDIKAAISVAEKYRYSFYDSLIIASALESNCKILYSEDLQHNQIIKNKLKIINPFL